MNLIPEKTGINPSYACTWGLQGAWPLHPEAVKFNYQGGARMAHTLTEENIKTLLQSDVLKQDRADAFLLLDMGWDFDPEYDHDKQQYVCNSLEISRIKFPSLKGNGLQRLRQMVEMVKDAGFQGLGVWITCHVFGEGKDGFTYSGDELYEKFRQTFLFYRDAGVSYLKCDYGAHAWDPEFRRKVSDLAREAAPELIIEQCWCMGPFNDEYCNYDKYELHHEYTYEAHRGGQTLKDAVSILPHCNVFRTYDVSHTLEYPITLSRVGALLKGIEGTKTHCVLNTESTPILSAGLGTAVGFLQLDSEAENRSCIRTLRWQRFAPPIPVGGPVLVDERYMEDSCDFHEESDWVKSCIDPGYVVHQKAPARIVRNMEKLPNVRSETILPYVVAARHPETGAVSLAAMPRVLLNTRRFTPRAEVGLEDLDYTKPIGIFGKYHSVTLGFAKLPDNPIFWMQDLYTDTAVDITSHLFVNSNTIRIPGSILERICKGDEPGVVLCVKEK